MQHVSTAPAAAPPSPGVAVADVSSVSERAARERRENRRRAALQKRLAAPLLAIALLAGWQIASFTGALSELIVPSPAAIFLRIVKDFPMLIKHSWITSVEVLLGFGAAAILAIATALVIFFSSLFRSAVYPLLVALQTVPKVALAPLMVLYLGYGWGPKFFLAGLLAFFPIVVSTVVGLESVDSGLIRMIKSMGAKPTQIFFKVRLPAALPNLFAGLKVGSSLAVIGAILGEYIAAERGLGYLQLQANANMDTSLNMAAIVVISLLGTVLYGALAFIESAVSFVKVQK
jgi:NitT/TauT family transport system permease protein